MSTDFGATFAPTIRLGAGTDQDIAELDAVRRYAGNGSRTYLRDVAGYATMGLNNSVRQNSEIPVDTLLGYSCAPDIAVNNNGNTHIVCTSWPTDDDPNYEILYYRKLVALYGDVNGDNRVDIDDLFAVLAAWGSCDDCPEDVTEDGRVDIDDIFAVLSSWGSCD